jgi:hypothetical protein
MAGFDRGMGRTTKLTPSLADSADSLGMSSQGEGTAYEIPIRIARDRSAVVRRSLTSLFPMYRCCTAETIAFWEPARAAEKSKVDGFDAIHPAKPKLRYRPEQPLFSPVPTISGSGKTMSKREVYSGWWSATKSRTHADCFKVETDRFIPAERPIQTDHSVKLRYKSPRPSDTIFSASVSSVIASYLCVSFPPGCLVQML